jgi:hypothetical protein
MISFAATPFAAAIARMFSAGDLLMSIVPSGRSVA